MKKQNIEEEIKFFDTVAKKGGHYDDISELGYRRIRKMIKPYLSIRILDAGCATGAFAVQLKKMKKNIKITGIDLNKNFIRVAKETNLYDRLICDNIENRNIFRKGEFDSIICPYLLHHFPDIQNVINNFEYWLKPGGNLIILDPNGGNYILKTSYFIRLILLKFVSNDGFASPNESNKTPYTFIKALSNFKIIKMKAFDILTIEHTGSPFLSWINILAYFRQRLLDLYNNLPFIKYKESNLFIVAKKVKVS